MDKIDNIYIINLDKDKDRLDNMKRQMNKIGKSFIRISGVDGKLLTFKDIDNTNFFCKYFCSPSMIGIFMSHYKTWQKVLENRDNLALIMEDDCELVDDFQIQLKYVLDELFTIDPDFDFLYLSCGGACDIDKNYNFINIVQKLFLTNIQTKIKDDINTKFIFVPETPIGFNCYIVSQKCVKKLLKYMEKITYHVDVAFLNLQDKFKIYASSKILAYQYASATQSTQTEHFPVILNTILDNYKCKKRVSYSYYMSTPLFYIYKYNFTTYLLIIILIILVIPQPFKQIFVYIIWIYLFIEFIYYPLNIEYIIYWIIIIYITFLIFGYNKTEKNKFLV